MILAGFPPAMQLGGMFLVTMEPFAITEFLPMCTPLRMETLDPMKTLSPMQTALAHSSLDTPLSSGWMPWKSLS